MYYSKDALDINIYNPHPDAREMGPPKRVDRMEDHIGERVASSKKRITWHFTLGESDTIHTIALTHSVLSSKKSVEFDGREVHFSAVATLSDWNITMHYEHTEYKLEVRINDVVSEEVPKYDLVINRIPFRRWDVYRRPKFSQPPIPHVPYMTAPPAQAPQTFGTHKWGPAGMRAAPVETNRQNYERPRRQSSSLTGFSFMNQGEKVNPLAPDTRNRENRTNSLSQLPQQPPVQPREINLVELNGIDDTVPKSTKTEQQPVQQPEINLLELDAVDDADTKPQITEQSLLDPIMQTQNQTTIPPQQAMPAAPVAAMQFVDPFGKSPQTSNLTTMNPASVGHIPTQNAPNQWIGGLTPVQNVGLNAPNYSAMHSLQPMSASVPQPSQQMPSAIPSNHLCPPHMMPQYPGVALPKPSSAPQAANAGNVNYNISQLMNPINVSSAQPVEGKKSINIDAFAGLK